MKIKIWNGQEYAGNPGRGPVRTNKPVYSSQPLYIAARPSDDQAARRNAKEIINELNALIGLKGVKKLIEEIYAFVEIQKCRQIERLAVEPLSLHMIFKGNPGTGKTTVARILGKLFKEVGVLPKGHLVEVERADMVGEFIGHTAQKTREQIKKALGGILFIDEAYSLARGGEKDFGKEAIDALVKGMEDHRDNLILILAGYQDEMDWFVESNPGLRSRFPVHLSFPDYSSLELLDIADLMLKKKQYELSSGAREELRFVIEKEQKCHENSGNARLVRNLIERAMRRQAVRLLKPGNKMTRDDLMLLKREDLIGEANDI
ncbi:Stage V sporulation protein K [Pelotomaculum schinkii]|uniref:Stage V sporulation protein K n=1 Tax=Pelotomaculum schinkii TaxID=78350 RepID=A0A4Y7RDJ7_9FIRM|nr:Stage V sporulation protein K [Pelotomaculum schinkii]TEB15688.1 Stage V sporulation protein K [Pelotomaculum sp. FP]